MNAPGTLLAFLAAPLLLLACPEATTNGSECVAGASDFCACPTGEAGFQVCNGGRWGVCQCESSLDASVVPDGGVSDSAAGDTASEVHVAPEFSPAERAKVALLAPATLPPPPLDVTNAWADDPQAALLGQQFFFEKRFAGPLLDADHLISAGSLGEPGETGRVSCADCHVPSAGFSDTRSASQQISLGAGWGTRKAPSLLDVGQATLLMWDGRHDTLFNQPFGAFENVFEMNTSRLFVARAVFDHHRQGYEAVFGPMPPLDDESRFPAPAPAQAGCDDLDGGVCRGRPGSADYDGMSADDQRAVTRVVVNVGKALGAYQRLLACGPGRLDAWAGGDEAALTHSEQRGLKLFVGKAGCSGCHSGPYMSDQAFHNVGVKDDIVAVVFFPRDDPGAQVGFALAQESPLNASGIYSDGDDGRVPTEIPDASLGAFRTPTLRCVAQRPSFFHNATFTSLKSVVRFFSEGGHAFGYLGDSVLTPLDLSQAEQDDLVAFLHALDGDGPAGELLVAPGDR